MSTDTYYEVIVSPDVAQTRAGATGTRNCLVATADGEHLLTFSRTPTVLPWLPAEVKADEHLHVTEVAEPASAVYPLPDPPDGDGDAAGDNPLAVLSYNDLKKLAAAHELDTTGKRAELEARIRAHASAESLSADALLGDELAGGDLDPGTELRPERIG